MSTLIDDIIANFKQQYILYRDMERESRQQLEGLQGSGYVEVGLILERRRSILLELDQLGRDNRNMQQEVIKELGIKEFNLSQLKACISTEKWSTLAKLIDQLGQLLQIITAIDGQSQQLMAKLQASGGAKKTGQIKHSQALQAYQQTLRQNKES